MITFPCRCGHVLNVTEDQAGGTIQCPRCGRLNDIPMLSELAGLEADGTVKLDVREQKREADRLKELSRAFMRRGIGDEEIDLRPTLEEVKRAGDVGPLEWEPDRAKPKYDPVTGELVRPLEVRQETPGRSDESLLSRRKVREIIPSATPGALELLVLLLRPLNLIVSFMILGAFVFLQVLIYLGLSIAVKTLGLDVTPAMIVIYGVFWWIVLAHYANVIDDVGREGRDELPRPLRDLSWQDDLWGPLWKSTAGLALCYWPMVVAGSIWGGYGFVGVLETILFVGGSIALPAVWITLICDGTPANLRPDRVMSVIRACGIAYVVPLLAGVPALLGHGWGVLGLWMVPEALSEKYPVLSAMNHYAIADSSLLVGIFFAQYCCWYMGILYRRHHEEFAWVMQRHTSRRHPQARGG